MICLVVAPAEKASLLGSLFENKQCHEQFVTPVSCFPQSRCNYWPSGLLSFCVCFLILTKTYGGVDFLGVFPLFLKMVSDIIAPKLRIIIVRSLIHRGSLPECWRPVNVTPIAKGAPSPDGENYHLILITPILSKVKVKLVSHKFSSFCEKYCFLLMGKVWAALMHC